MKANAQLELFRSHMMEGEGKEEQVEGSSNLDDHFSVSDIVVRSESKTSH